MKKRDQKPKRKKQKKQYKFIITLVIVIALLIFLALADITPYPKAFWMLAVSSAVAVSLIYWIFTKRFAHSIALFLVWWIMLVGGLEDIFVYIFKGSIPESMPHLYDEPVMGNVARLLGFGTVTPISLIISVVSCAVIAFFVVWLLIKQKW